VQQKTRTLEALIAATRSLLATGATPTVEEAAARASVSRTTAYRYFPTQQDLLVAAYPEIEKESILGEDPPPDLSARFDIVFAEMARQITENEIALRAMLRLSSRHHPTEISSFSDAAADASGSQTPYRRSATA
jgi:AcrR family transcriptional regulator